MKARMKQPGLKPIRVILAISMLCLLGFTLTTCTRDRRGEPMKCRENNTLKLPAHMMETFFFRPGSWWVYEEETTKKRDSVWVVTATLTAGDNYQAKQACSCGWGLCNESAVVEITDDESAAKGQYWLRYELEPYATPESRSTDENAFVVWRSFYSQYDTWPRSRWLWYDGNRLSGFDYGDNSFQTAEQLTVAGVTYKEVFGYVRDFPAGDEWAKEAWYARHIGLIRYRKADGTVWSLVKSNLVR